MLTCCILTLLEGNKTKGAVQHTRTFHGKWNCSFLSFPRRPIIKLWWLTADSCQSLNQEKVSVWYVSYYSGGKKMSLSRSHAFVIYYMKNQCWFNFFLCSCPQVTHCLLHLQMFSGPGWMFQHPCHTFKNTSIKFCVFFSFLIMKNCNLHSFLVSPSLYIPISFFKRTNSFLPPLYL